MPASDGPLVVAVKPAPPFVIKEGDGECGGISIGLWEGIAAGLGIRFRYEETELDALLDDVSAGQFDLGVGAITVSAEREARLDFTQPFFNSGFAIAVRLPAPVVRARAALGMPPAHPFYHPGPAHPRRVVRLRSVHLPIAGRPVPPEPLDRPRVQVNRLLVFRCQSGIHSKKIPDQRAPRPSQRQY